MPVGMFTSLFLWTAFTTVPHMNIPVPVHTDDITIIQIVVNKVVRHVSSEIKFKQENLKVEQRVFPLVTFSFDSKKFLSSKTSKELGYIEFDRQMVLWRHIKGGAKECHTFLEGVLFFFVFKNKTKQFSFLSSLIIIIKITEETDLILKYKLKISCASVRKRSLTANEKTMYHIWYSFRWQYVR